MINKPFVINISISGFAKGMIVGSAINLRDAALILDIILTRVNDMFTSVEIE